MREIGDAAFYSKGYQGLVAVPGIPLFLSHRKSSREFSSPLFLA